MQWEFAIRTKLVSTESLLYVSRVLLKNLILVSINIPLWRVFIPLRSLLLRAPIVVQSDLDLTILDLTINLDLTMFP